MTQIRRIDSIRQMERTTLHALSIDFSGNEKIAHFMGLIRARVAAGERPIIAELHAKVDAIESGQLGIADLEDLGSDEIQIECPQKVLDVMEVIQEQAQQGYIAGPIPLEAFGDLAAAELVHTRRMITSLGLGEKLNTDLLEYENDSRVRERKIFFPIAKDYKLEAESGHSIKDAYSYVAFWTSEGGDDWTAEERDGVATMLFTLSHNLQAISNASNLETYISALDTLLSTSTWIKDQTGAKIRGATFNYTDGREFKTDREIKLPDSFYINVSIEIMAYHMAMGAIRAIGGAKEISKKMALEAIERLKRLDSTSESFIDFIGQRIEKHCPEFENIKLKDSEAPTVIKPEIGKMNGRKLTDLSRKKEFRLSRGESVIKLTREIRDLTRECQRKATYVAGQVEGYVEELDGKGVPEIVEALFIRRGKIENPGDRSNIVSEGHFHLILDEKPHRLRWRMDAKGEFYFIINDREKGWENFKSTQGKAFYFEMKRKVLKGLKDILVKVWIDGEDIEGVKVFNVELPVDEELPEIENEDNEDAERNEGVNVRKTRTRTLRPHRQRVLGQLGAKRKAPKIDEEAHMARVHALFKKIARAEISEDDDALEGISLCSPHPVIQDGVHVDTVWVPGDTMELAKRWIADPSSRNEIRVRIIPAGMGMAGYSRKIDKERRIRFCLKKERGIVSQRRIDVLTELAETEPLNPDVGTTTTVRMDLGTDLSDLPIERVILGQAEVIEEIRRRLLTMPGQELILEEMSDIEGIEDVDDIDITTFIDRKEGIVEQEKIPTDYNILVAGMVKQRKAREGVQSTRHKLELQIAPLAGQNSRFYPGRAMSIKEPKPAQASPIA